MNRFQAFAFSGFNLRPYALKLIREGGEEASEFKGGVVRVEPGFSQLTARLLSTLESKT